MACRRVHAVIFANINNIRFNIRCLLSTYIECTRQPGRNKLQFAAMFNKQSIIKQQSFLVRWRACTNLDLVTSCYTGHNAVFHLISLHIELRIQ